MEIKLQINDIKELSKYLENVTWKQSDEFYQNAFNLIKGYSEHNRLERTYLDECCWQIIKHINFYKLEKMCRVLYEYISSNSDKVSECFMSCLQEEYYYDGDELFGGGSSNFIFERFFNYSIKAKNFIIVAKMVNCDNEEYVLENIDFFVKNNQLEVIEDFILEMATYNFKEIFEKLLGYKNEKIDAFAIDIYRKYNEL